MVKWISAFGLRNNKWRWWFPSSLLVGLWLKYVGLVQRLAAIWWCSAFIVWTGWTLAMTLSYDDSTINIVVVIVIISVYLMTLEFTSHASRVSTRYTEETATHCTDTGGCMNGRKASLEKDLPEGPFRSQSKWSNARKICSLNLKSYSKWFAHCMTIHLVYTMTVINILNSLRVIGSH